MSCNPIHWPAMASLTAAPKQEQRGTKFVCYFFIVQENIYIYSAREFGGPCPGPHTANQPSSLPQRGTVGASGSARWRQCLRLVLVNGFSIQCLIESTLCVDVDLEVGVGVGCWGYCTRSVCSHVVLGLGIVDGSGWIWLWGVYRTPTALSMATTGQRPKQP